MYSFVFVLALQKNWGRKSASVCIQHLKDSKSGNSPCTIVQYLVPNFAKNEK